MGHSDDSANHSEHGKDCGYTFQRETPPLFRYKLKAILVVTLWQRTWVSSAHVLRTGVRLNPKVMYYCV